MIDHIIGIVLLLGLVGFVITMPLMTSIYRVVESAVQGIGRVLVTQLLLNKVLLLSIVGYFTRETFFEGHTPDWVPLILAVAVAVSPYVLLVRWYNWRRKDY